MKATFVHTENSKMRETNKLVFILLQRLDLRSLNKHGLLQNVSTYYIWKK